MTLNIPEPNEVIAATIGHSDKLNKSMTSAHRLVLDVVNAEKHDENRKKLQNSLRGFEHCISLNRRLGVWANGCMDIDYCPEDSKEFGVAYDMSSDIEDALRTSINIIQAMQKACPALRNDILLYGHLSIAKNEIKKMVDLYMRYADESF